MAGEERSLGDWLSSWAHKDAHAVCAPSLRVRLNTALRVELMARHVPSCARNETSKAFETLFVSFPCINSLARLYAPWLVPGRPPASPWGDVGLGAVWCLVSAALRTGLPLDVVLFTRSHGVKMVL